MTKTNIVPIGSTSEGERAYERVRPLLEKLRDDIREVAAIVSNEYCQLPKLAKAVFADKVKEDYGWSQSRLTTFAQIGRDFPKKQRLISRSAPSGKIDDLNMEIMREIVSTPDALLQTAAKQGMFDEPVTSREIRKLRKTGQIPRPAEKAQPQTDLQKIRALMVGAEHHMKRASLNISEITAIMRDAEITDAKGREATALVQTFEKLCLEISAANPKTSKRAFAILRGEA